MDNLPILVKSDSPISPPQTTIAVNRGDQGIIHNKSDNRLHVTIFALIQTYHRRLHDVYRSISLRAQRLLCNSDPLTPIAHAIIRAIGKAEMLPILTDPHVSFDALPDHKPAESRLGCVYYNGHFYPIAPKGYVGRANDLRLRQAKHATSARGKEPKQLHHQHTKMTTSKKTTVLCLLEDLDEDIAKQLQSLDYGNVPEYIYVEEPDKDNQKGEKEDLHEDPTIAAIQILIEYATTDPVRMYVPDGELV